LIFLLATRGSTDSNSSGGSSKEKKQKVDKRKRDWLRDCQEFFGSRENALKAIEEHAEVHYKPVVETTLPGVGPEDVRKVA